MEPFHHLALFSIKRMLILAQETGVQLMDFRVALRGRIAGLLG